MGFTFCYSHTIYQSSQDLHCAHFSTKLKLQKIYRRIIGSRNREGSTMEKPQKQELKDEDIKYGGIKAMPFIIGNETFEKLGTIGTSSNLLVYLTTVFRMKSISAQNLVNVFQGSANLATLLGAYLSDTYYGRYYTLGFSSISSFLGMVVLSLTAAIHSLHPHNEGATAGQMAVLVTALVLLVIGAGGIRPCNLAFGADQFDPKTESGKRGISSFFNWYYFTFTFAMMVSMTIIVYVQSSISWALGLALPAILMFFSCAFFFVGTPIYVRIQPQGSPLLSVVQVVVAAFKKRKLRLPTEEEDSVVALFDYIPNTSTNSGVDSEIPYTPQFRFLNKGGIITEEDQIKDDGSANNPWKLCSIQQAEEVKCILRVIPIWISGIIHYVMAVTLQNYVVFQALQSNRRLGNTNFNIPAASYNFFTMLAVTIWLPIYDRLIVPLLRRITRIESGITLLQKIGVGIVIAVLTMILSGYTEHKRRELGKDGAISSMSGFWLVPQLVLGGLSEAFTMVGFVELYYKQVPDRMRSIGGSFLFSGSAISSYFSSFLVSVVDKLTTDGSSGSWLSEDLNKGRLDYFYYLIAGLELLNLVYFLACSKWYKYKGNAGAVLVLDKENAAPV